MSDRLTKLAPWAVRISALWVLLGAFFKLFLGTPNDLPPVVRSFFLGPDLTFRLAIAVELSVALTALIRPKLGFAPLAAMFAVFVAILAQLVMAGEASCGCFGSKVTIPPAVMMAIDGACLVAMLATRPWSLARRPLPVVAWGVLVAASWVAPWVVIDSSAPVPSPKPPQGSTGEGDGSGQPAPEPAAWSPPDPLPRYTELNIDRWAGKSIYDTELATWLDLDMQIPDGEWILYSATCDHCGEYLRQLANDFASDPKMYTLIRVDSEENTALHQVDMKPPGEETQLVPGVEYVILPDPVPWRLKLEGGTVLESEHVGG